MLYLDSAPFKISAHLTDIFVHIRKPDVGRDLWIDAVCIDQTNDVERGRQVEMMGDIYQNCTADLAWIEDPKSEVSGNVEEIQLGSYKDWEALSRFLAPKPDPGVHHFPWDRGVLASGFAGILYRVAEMDKQRVFRNRADDKSTLLDILARFCDRESSDPRDRVYGLLGLLPQHPTHRRLEVDYSIPSARLFVEVTAEVIHQSQNLDILCQSPWERRGVPQCTRLGRRTEALPSWAVDFAARELSWNVGDS